MTEFYRRHLPHQVPDGFPVFLTWNLKGATPKEALERLAHERRLLEKQLPRNGETPAERRIREAKLLFATADAFLDGPAAGPLHLQDSAAAKVVEDAILFGAQERYELFAWCVMPNHVHVLLTPILKLPRVTKGLKGYTAHAINGLHSARGRIFWQDESYDHWARDEEEVFRIIAYIEGNPVAAKLCNCPEDWQWSSARLRNRWPPGKPYRRSGFPA